MSTLIIGSEGSMGKRHGAGHNYLDEPFWAVDKETSHIKMLARAAKADRILVCTPTDTHGEILRSLFPLKKPILCEKPICKDLDELRDLFSYAKKKSVPFNMVMQYGELLKEETLEADGDTLYNYYKHGSDNIFFDCIQMLAYANGDLILREDSPIWTCMINGQKLNLSDMDGAYVSQLRRWIRGKLEQDHQWLFEAHEYAVKLTKGANEQYN